MYRINTIRVNKQLRSAMVLSACQALYTASFSIDLTFTGIVGYQLADDKSLATLPFVSITIAAASVTVFASLLMQRVGRKTGFMVGACFATIGSLISIIAIYRHDFWLFCLGTASVGVFQAFAQYYRLAAADSVDPPWKGTAISVVLSGGVVAAIFGPLLAVWSQTLFAPVMFAGSYAVVTVMGLVSIAVLAVLLPDMEQPAQAQTRDGGASRSLNEIVIQPDYLAAVSNNAFGYAVMMLAMTITPLAAVACGHGTLDGANIIEWHLVGMFAPSFFSGWLIGRVGVGYVLLLGISLSALCSILVLTDTHLITFYIALLCLGVGWNFMYVGGTTLLTRSYKPSDRTKAQAFSEFATYGATAIASLAAGQILARYGWHVVNIILLVLLVFPTAATLRWMTHHQVHGRPSLAN